MDSTIISWRNSKKLEQKTDTIRLLKLINIFERISCQVLVDH